jgi:hypothetical protein
MHGLDRAAIVLLLVVHAGLFVWAIAGIVEMIFPGAIWAELSNPLFSPAVLAAQWAAILLGATTFLLGYLRRWRRLPEALAVCYAIMAGVCAYETFALLRHDSRFAEMALEYAAYVVIVAYLYLSPAVRRRIAPASILAAV